MWDDRRERCCWVDIEGRAVYEMDWESRQVVRFQLERRVSLVVPGKGDYLIAALEGGVFRLDTREERSPQLLSDLDIAWHNLRCNDGSCDSRGRLWVGTMDLQGRPGAGSVYSIDNNRRVKEKISEVTISNGIVWSADNKRMYFIDSITREVRSFLFNEHSGDIRYENTPIIVPEKMGLPDGMAIDREDKLWVAFWGGYGVGRFDPSTGSMIDFIEVPAPHTTSCCFAGPLLDHLVITTARQDMTAGELQSCPDSGSVFIAKPGVKGIPSYRCGL